jgi:hypothetical protein
MDIPSLAENSAGNLFPGCQLQRELGVAYKTAWRMLKLIREAMGNKSMGKTFDVFVDVDEPVSGSRSLGILSLCSSKEKNF